MSVEILFVAATLLLTLYLVLWHLSQLVIALAALLHVWRYLWRRTPRNLALAFQLTAPPRVSVIVPARNEALTIVESVRAMLALEYTAREIVIVNDDSSDATLEVLRRAFRLVPAPVAFDRPLATAPIRGVYRSTDEPSLVVVDKVSGGSKGDAVNAGINVASGSLVAVIDADTVLEPDSLTRGIMPFLEDPTTVAVGGYVGIANGCRIEGARVREIAMPRCWLARFQVIEYMRSFLLFRLACARANAVTLVSGAFGVFSRPAVVAVGGFDHTAIGEDMDLTVRLHRFYRTCGTPMHIAFVPLPTCWTQAPDDFASLRAQRYRWRRGLMQVLWRHRRAIGNPRFGVMGAIVLPYTVIFEGLGPLIEVAGYTVVITGLVTGAVDWSHVRVLIAVAILFGAAATLVALMLSDLATEQYSRARDLGTLFAAAILENAGYHQLNAWWSCVGTVQAIRKKSGWGHMTRRSFL